MKILIFEYITGGGFSEAELPTTLAQEGLLMLRALLRDLSAINNVELLLILDDRFMAFLPLFDIVIVPVGRNQNAMEVLEAHIDECDAVWPIAPEIDDILFDLTRLIENHEKCVLSSPSRIVAVAADKLRTYRY